MILKIISSLVLLLASTAAMASISTEDLANVLAVKLNEAVLAQDLSLVAKTRGLQNDRSEDFKKFFKDHKFDANSLSTLHFSSRDSILLIHLGAQGYRMDLSQISKGLVEIDGRTVKVSAQIEENYQALLRTFSGTAKNLWFYQLVQRAHADFFENLNNKVAALAGIAAGAVDFNDSLTTKNLMLALLHPLTNESIPEDFTCYGPDKVYYSVLAAPEKKGSDFKVNRRSFIFEVTSSAGKRKLSVNGMGCEQVPMVETSEGWASNSSLPIAQPCLNESKKQILFSRCCATKGCEQDLQKQIAIDKKVALSKYKNVPAELKATQ